MVDLATNGYTDIHDTIIYKMLELIMINFKNKIIIILEALKSIYYNNNQSIQYHYFQFASWCMLFVLQYRLNQLIIFYGELSYNIDCTMVLYELTIQDWVKMCNTLCFDLWNGHSSELHPCILFAVNVDILVWFANINCLPWKVLLTYVYMNIINICHWYAQKVCTFVKTCRTYNY